MSDQAPKTCNHIEAVEFAEYTQDMSNLARCYLSLKADADMLAEAMEVLTRAVEKHDFLSCTLIHETQEARAALAAHERGGE